MVATFKNVTYKALTLHWPTRKGLKRHVIRRLYGSILSWMIYTDKQETFKRWVTDYSDALYAYSVNHGFDTEGAKDMVQETFLSAWRTMDGFHGKASAKNWLFIILKSRIADYFRNVANRFSTNSMAQKDQDYAFFDDEEHWQKGFYPQDWQVNLSDQIERKDFHSVFSGCSSKLKEIHSAVFVMKYIDDKTSDEICKDLAITASNYWVILHRAKVQLRACLEKNWLSR